MSIKYKAVKQVFGFDKTNAVKYVARPVPGEMLKDLLRDMAITRMNQIDTDYTNGNAGGNDSGNTGGNNGGGDDNYIDPNA